MEPIRVHKGIVAPLDKQDVDTDQIIPKQFLKRIERTGFGEFLFNDWRTTAAGAPNPTFVLNDARYRGASILVAGRNFGCGSSREHAVWALADYGFRVIIAPSFGDIFATNCTKNGVAAVALKASAVATIIQLAQVAPGFELTVDLEQCVAHAGLSFIARFQMEPSRRNCLLNGLDDIGQTLAHESDIAIYERERATAGSRRS